MPAEAYEVVAKQMDADGARPEFERVLRAFRENGSFDEMLLRGLVPARCATRATWPDAGVHGARGVAGDMDAAREAGFTVQWQRPPAGELPPRVQSVGAAQFVENKKNPLAGPGPGVENCYVFKSRLQEYAQKAGLPTPEYHTLKEGPSHEPIFKSTVVVNNTKYDSLPGFFSRKAAEQSAAEVALMEIVKSVPATETKSIPAVQETGLCKNLLQEYAQKMNYAIPSYICSKQASGVAPFVCAVEIGGIQYIGAAARTKKDAEIKAARTALLAIQGQSESCANGAMKYIVVPGQRQVKETDKKPTETPKSLKVKKSGGKKKWNKRKFMRKTDQIVDAEKDGAREAGDVHDSDVPMQATITDEPSRDSIVLHPDEEARIVEQELLRDMTMLQADKEAISVKQGIIELEPPRDPATAKKPNEEARCAEQEPLGSAEVVKPNMEARAVEQESM
ncbi:double-stranded RNA-binding protein 8-like [Panicum miliaceum]|uniref:Double-stranded RNA-binding protein 8-like n=1 Tax=Panicum miliaceum TaxID=4540 RepID=A0A3L6Q5P2_PANMI|nr:double-stranded RNA-binding protein 8-like [Panicum miliaceum]